MGVVTEHSFSNMSKSLEFTTKEDTCNGSLCRFHRTSEISNLSETEQVEDNDTYLERSLGFLIIGSLGIVSNVFAILVLSSSAKIRKKVMNTLLIHQSFVDLFSCIALVGTAHLDGLDPHGLEGFHAHVYCFFVMCKLPLWLMMDVSSFSLVFLNIERYISIVFPFYHHTNVTRKKVIMILPITWILAVLEQTWVCSCFGPKNGACALNNSTSYSILIITYLILHFFLPVLIVLILYGHMFLSSEEVN